MHRFNRSALALVAVASCIVALSATAQQSPNPDSPRYKGVVAIQEFLADESADAAQTFLDEKIAVSYREEAGDEAVLEMLRRLHEEFASLSSRGPRPVGPLSASIMFDSDMGSRTISFTMSEGDTSRFASITTSGDS